MAKPILSIIIPAYNCGNQITTIVNSIISQPFTNWELIIINDKSTDNTKEVLDNLAQLDHRIIIINQRKNGGASTARNVGIKKSSGQYLMFLDADDNIKPTTITTFLDHMTDDVDLCVGGFTMNNLINNQVIHSDEVCVNQLPTRQPDESFRLYILRLLGLDGRLYQVWNKLYRADIIKKHHLAFQPGVDFGEDLVFNLDYFAHMTGEIKFIYRSLYLYNQSLDAGTFSKSSLIYQNRQSNYHELTRFMASEPDSPVKTDLLNWIQYNWLYSHLLAISGSSLSAGAKLAKWREVARLFTYPPIGSAAIIGQKRVQIEKILPKLLKYPRLGIFVISTTNHLKHNRLTASLWQKLRRLINT